MLSSERLLTRGLPPILARSTAAVSLCRCCLLYTSGSAQAQDLQLGSGSYIGASGDYAGFEDQIAGHQTGEEFDITVQFPENYTEEMAGKVADFHIVLNEIYTENVPELTDEWVQSNSDDSENVDQYREEVRKQLEEQADASV